MFIPRIANHQSDRPSFTWLDRLLLCIAVFSIWFGAIATNKSHLAKELTSHPQHFGFRRQEATRYIHRLQDLGIRFSHTNQEYVL
jgi:hypothetical protein